MAKGKTGGPAVTQAAILTLAGIQLQGRIIEERQSAERLARNLEEGGLQDKARHLRKMTDRDLAHTLEQLRAVEVLYQIETGAELGLLAALEGEEEE